MTFLKKICNKLSSFHNMCNFSARKEIAFFVEKAVQASAYERRLLLDQQEADEISEQMLIANDIIERKAKLLMHKDFTNELMFDTYSKEVQDKLFFSAIDYYRKYDKYFNLLEHIDKYFNAYGIAEKLSEMILKASIKNDIELKDALMKYHKQ